MALPQNYLDKFATYTYHFELHAAKSWDELKGLSYTASEAGTSRFASNGTLMINTRKDAHQTIDEVSFDVIGPCTSRGDAPVGVVDIHVVIKEPGGFSFIEKLNVRMQELEVSAAPNAIFGLKIVFVGRTPENAIEILPLRIIPMHLSHMSANFLPEGGVYQLVFVGSSTMASTRPGEKGQHLSYAFTNKNLSFEANTVEEALQKLQEKLNSNYTETYKTQLNNNGGSKVMKYKIEFDRADVSGPVVGVVKNSFASDDLKKFSFNSTQSITSMIMDIIKRSPDMCNKIGATTAALSKELHQGAFMPIIVPKVYPKDGEVEVTFDVVVYKGGGGIYEFEYFFAGAGKNVDVQSFNLEFKEVLGWLSTKTKTGIDSNANFSAELPTIDPKRYRNLIHEPITQQTIYVPVERSDIDKLPGDVAFLPAPTMREGQAFNAMPLTAVPALRMASNAIGDFTGAIDPEQVITIRGHYQLLKDSISAPDERSTTAISSGVGVWFKLNIYMPDGNGGKRKFYYTGKSAVISIQNHFSGGVFTQKVRMLMNENKRDTVNRNVTDTIETVKKGGTYESEAFRVEINGTSTTTPGGRGTR